MKKNKILMMVVLSIFCMLSTAYAADITGVWRFDGYPDSRVILSFDKGKLFYAAYHEYGGKQGAVIGHGQGTFDGKKAIFGSTASRRPTPTWGGANNYTTMELLLSDDGNTLSGTWKNDVGQGPQKLFRLY